eukprot:15075764-Alexandrium_andersonii.AAC.2
MAHPRRGTPLQQIPVGSLTPGRLGSSSSPKELLTSERPEEQLLRQLLEAPKSFQISVRSSGS